MKKGLQLFEYFATELEDFTKPNWGMATIHSCLGQIARKLKLVSNPDLTTPRPKLT